MGDFTGFTFGGYHSFDDLNVIRVSGGDRYEEQLHPEIKDITAEVPGRDGDYYFGSNYGPKTIDVEIAFDSLTELEFRKLRQVFGTKKIKELIFDERPYKRYMAKIESPMELSYVCFDEPMKTLGEERDGVRVAERTTSTIIEEIGNSVIDDAIVGEAIAGATIERTITNIEREKVTPYVIDYSKTRRVYKGEGKISFKCYFPFAKSVYKQIPIGEEESDWAISSGILTRDEYQNIDKYNNETNSINIYNPGDIDTGFRLYLPASIATEGVTLNYKIDGENNTASLVINPITLKTDKNDVLDMGVLIDTTNEIIVGVSQFTIDSIITTSSNLYNDYIEAGYFFRFEPNTIEDGTILEIEGGGQGIEIFYDYLYF